ncbi:MAG: stage II sporulation protein P [bacterium]|nr:stage II sporulation protein P [bacterium]MCM1375974.1 stage II sporulation protein P [Muribaculum sp.]
MNAVLITVACGFLLLAWQAFSGGGGADKDSLINRLMQMGRDQSVREILPVLARQGSQTEAPEETLLQREALEEWMPGYLYQTQTGQVAVRVIGEDGLNDSADGSSLSEQEETELSLEELMRLENQESQHGDSTIKRLDLESLLAEESQNTEEAQGTDREKPFQMAEANQELMTQGELFVPHIRQQTVNMEELQNYETLRNRFYTVDSITNIGRELLDVEKLTQRDMTIDKGQEGPHILIYHTHSQEGFADSVSGDASTTIMGVGQHLADILEQQYGYQVLHHLGTYDKETRDNAYSRSLPEITRILEENPQIQVVIDLHRDAVADENTHLVMDLDGRPTARFMFFNGISWTRKTGNIGYLQNDNLADNLAFSFQMKLKAEEYYPGLTRKNYINGYRYNMHVRPRTLLIELGAQNNTLEEAMNACDPIAHLLDMVLSGE